MRSRRGFLALLAAVFSLPLWGRSTQRRTLLLNRCYVAGLQYHPGVDLPLSRGKPVRMIREPSNPHDSNAVALYADGIKLGYIPKKENTTLAMLLDQKAPLRARVERFDAEAKSWERVEIVVEQVG